MLTNPVKSNLLLYNFADVPVSIKGHMLDNPDSVKSNIHIDNRLYLNYQDKWCF